MYDYIEDNSYRYKLGDDTLVWTGTKWMFRLYVYGILRRGHSESLLGEDRSYLGRSKIISQYKLHQRGINYMVSNKKKYHDKNFTNYGDVWLVNVNEKERIDRIESAYELDVVETCYGPANIYVVKQDGDYYY
jgi:gamma-glutamylcyclotransferase (GGCT)/AIG2-like uncharacterized protein YtfP